MKQNKREGKLEIVEATVTTEDLTVWGWDASGLEADEPSAFADAIYADDEVSMCGLWREFLAMVASPSMKAEMLENAF